jgi:ATP-binding cassette, subfamily B, bacterial PglK
MREDDNNTVPRALYQIYGQLSRRRRVQLFLLMLLMLAGAFAELVTIGAVLPFLALIADPERASSYPVLGEAFRYLGWDDATGILLPVTILFATTAAAAGAIRILLTWASIKFVIKVGHDLGVEVYRLVLHQPYSYHVSHNTSEMIAAVNKIQIITGAVLQPLLQAVIAVVIAAFIMAALIAIDPTSAFGAALIFGLFYLGVTVATRSRLRANSRVIARSQSQRVQTVQEGLGGIRDVLIDNAQPVYVGKFRTVDAALRAAQLTNSFISGAPRFVIEAFGIVLIAFMALFLVSAEGGLATALPVLGALALGAQRMLPLLQQIYRTVAQVRGNRNLLFDICKLLTLAIPPEQRGAKPAPLPFDRAISLHDVGFRYSPDGADVLQNVDLIIQKGEKIGFIGRTGSGKSTLIDIIMGLLEPTRGKVCIDGRNLDHSHRRAWQARIAHVPQTIFLADTTIKENIAFGVPSEMVEQGRVEDAARMAQIGSFIETLPQGYDTMVGERGIRLSGGQRQRIGIARALYKRADVLVFDEATSALDSETEDAVMRAVAELGRQLTVLIIAHRLSTIADCDRIVTLSEGKVIASGAYDEAVGFPVDADSAHCA